MLIGWIAPRGVVAAAVAGAFAPDLLAHGYDDAELLVPIIFGVIITTVVLHGLSLGPLARRMGLAHEEGTGILIVGAATWVVALAQHLAKAGAEVILVDNRYRRVSRARQEGLDVHYGDVLAEESAMEIPMESVSYVLASTDDDAYNSLVCLRFNQWKFVFAEQTAHGFHVWQQPFVPLRLPKLFNLRSDPFETADHEAMDYERWAVEHLFLTVPAQQFVGQFLASFKEFPPSQKPGSFSIDAALDKLQEGAAGNR